MKKKLLLPILLALMFFSVSLSANAADYYVDATSGVDGNLGTSTGAAWQTISKVNGTVLNPGDNVYFKRGETWNEQLNITVSGTEGNLITFGSYDSGNFPVIDAQNSRDYAISFSNNLSYIRLENLRVQNAVTRNVWSDGTGSGFQFENIESYNGAGEGIWVRAKSDSSYNNITVRNAGTFCFRLSNEASDISVTNMDIDGCGSTGIDLRDITNLDFSDSTVLNATIDGFHLESLTGDYNIDTLTAGASGNGNGAVGIYFKASTDLDLDTSDLIARYNTGKGIYFEDLRNGTISVLADNLEAYNNGAVGISVGYTENVRIQNSTSRNNTGLSSGFGTSSENNNIEFVNCVANGNGWDGFSFKGSGSDFLVSKCKAYENGTPGSINSGDGYTSHDDVLGVKIHQSIAYDNRNAGVAIIGNTTGEVYNSTFYNNGETGFTRGGYWSNVSGGSGWELRSNIFKDNYPYEINTDANGWSNTDANYNLYHHTANAEVATLDNAVSTMDWNTYHTTNGYEVNSSYDEPLFIAASSGNFAIQTLSPAIDNGAVIETVTQNCSSDCTDFLANPLYGTPDLGAYEFQPTKIIGTDDIDISGGAIIYADGRYRNENSPSASLAKITVQPEEGFTSDQYGEWVNVSIVTWETSGGYGKTWTEDSDVIGSDSISHVVGDLAPDTNYDVYYTKQGGSKTKLGFYESNGSGEITFVYDKGYSQVTFEVEEGDNTIPTITNTTSSEITTSTASVTMSVSTSESAVCKFSTTSGTSFEDMTSFSTTGGTTHSKALSATVSEDRIYYVLCRDTSDNLSSESTVTFSVVVTNVSGLKPKMKISSKEKLAFKKLSKKLYSKNNKPKFSGESEALINGKVVIYVDGDKEEEVEVDALGKWSQKIKFKKNRTYELKFKYYDRNDNLIDSKKYKVKIDTEDPEFTSFPPEMIGKRVGQSIWWEAEDNHKIKKYKIYFGGKKIKTKTNKFDVPSGTARGVHQLKVRAYDKAGNKEVKTVNIRIW